MKQSWRNSYDWIWFGLSFFFGFALPIHIPLTNTLKMQMLFSTFTLLQANTQTQKKYITTSNKVTFNENRTRA